MTDLDRDRSNGRTAVQQCWDYLNALPGCPWGIVSNFRTIRLYHREKGSLSYEEFALQELRDRAAVRRVLLPLRARRAAPLAHRPTAAGPRTAATRRPIARKSVGDKLYREYQWRRLELIEHLNRKEGKDLDEAIRIAQKLLDRIIFIAFCEDRELLPEKSAGSHADRGPHVQPCQEPGLGELPRSLHRHRQGRQGQAGRSPPSTAGCSPTIRRSTPWNWSRRSGPTPSPDSAITTSPRKSTSTSSGTSSSARSRNWKNSASAASSP